MGCISGAILQFLRPTTTLSVSPPLKLLFSTFRRHTVSAPPPHHALSLSEREEVTSSQLAAREYADLNLSDKFCPEVGHVRIRQHVNPLRSSLMAPVEVPDWNTVYKDATLPLMVDIGSGSGRFLIWLAKRFYGLRNYLGLEIRPKLVQRAEYWVNELSLKNIHFIFANATVTFQQLVSTYPGPLVFVSILILIQSDVLEVALDMRDYFDAVSHRLVHIHSINPDVICDHDGWLLNNPMGIRTEREIHAECEGARIFRRMYQKQR